jgi:RNA polymerase sigma factor (sigma-70 family)
MAVLSPEQERLVIDNMGYAEGIARQTAIKLPIGEKYGIPMDIQDCVQIGYVGLVQAAQKFDASDYDPKRGSLETLFRSYAYNRIRGAIIDEVRRQTFVRRRGIEQGIKFQMLSMDYETNDDAGVLQVGFEENNDVWIDIVQAIDILDERESKVILGLTIGVSGRELAEDLGITESRISQIAQQARRKLKEFVAGERTK